MCVCVYLCANPCMPYIKKTTKEFTLLEQLTRICMSKRGIRRSKLPIKVTNTTCVMNEDYYLVSANAVSIILTTCNFILTNK